MFDMHYDLLSILYSCYLKNDYSYIDKIKIYFNDNNVTGVIANLYFMNEEEMKEEFGDIKIDVIEMFKISTKLFEKYFPNLKVLYSIEGCDYIKDTNELEELKKIGLNSILLVWNNKNKYGSGPRTDAHLTSLGKDFIKKAIDLGLIIDLSHMNINTFYDVINILKEEKSLGKTIKVIVSHSNCYDLYNIPRNITDKQIKELKDFDVVMGLVSYSFFLSKEKKNINELKHLYLNHIKHAIDILGIEHIGISTDDMTYSSYLFNSEIKDNIFDYKNIKKDIYKLLETYYNKEEIEKILFKNIERFI